MTDILTAQGLTKTFRVGKNNDQPVLKDIDLHIQAGEFVALMGPSGSGKSTLLYTISGMDQPTDGSAVFNGHALVSMPEKQLSKIRLCNMGFVFQHNCLLNNLSIFDNIVLSGYLAKRVSKREVDCRADALMQTLGIADLKHHDITQASGGQLQRASICRALINHPDIIFADEPTGALNSQAANTVIETLLTINQSGTTLLVASHDIKVAARAERVIYLFDGQVVAEKKLGKCAEVNTADRKEREKSLVAWLDQLGF